jgi:hypothetical protein
MSSFQLSPISDGGCESVEAETMKGEAWNDKKATFLAVVQAN